MIKYKSFKKLFVEKKFWKYLKKAPVDLPKTNIEKENLLKEVYLSVKNKTYHPSNPEFYITYNKGKGVARISPVFSVRDYIVYYYCVIRLEYKLARNRTENTFGGWSISGLRYRENEKNEIEKRLAELYDPTVSMPTWSFSPSAWYLAYKDFNAKLYITLKEFKAISQSGYAVEIDIANFYDSINLDTLLRKLNEVFDAKKREELALLFHFLRHWNKVLNHYNPQTVGLPQDVMNDCSRLLANFYLQEYDMYMKKICDNIGARYFRYADDQVIIVKNQNDIEDIVYRASRKLLTLGLAINQKKVNISTLEEMIENRSYEVFSLLLAPDAVKDQEASLKYVTEVVEIIQSDKRDNIKARGVPLLNQALSCDWTKVPYGLQVKMLSWYLDESYLERAKYYHFVGIYKKLQTESLKDDFVATLKKLSGRLIHNSFHYEVCAFMKEVGLDDSEITERISELRKIYSK